MDRLSYDAECIDKFWQDVAETGRYAQEPQTWAWPEDLERAIELVRAKQPEILVAFGCADGCRDPEQLLKAYPGRGLFIRKVFAIECTRRFEGSIRDRVRALGLEDRFEFLLNKSTATHEKSTANHESPEPNRNRIAEGLHAGR